MYLRVLGFQFLDMVECLMLKAHSVSEIGSASIFRWSREGGEPSLVDLLESYSLSPLNLKGAIPLCRVNYLVY